MVRVVAVAGRGGGAGRQTNGCTLLKSSGLSRALSFADQRSPRPHHEEVPLHRGPIKHYDGAGLFGKVQLLGPMRASRGSQSHIYVVKASCGATRDELYDFGM